MNLNRLTRLALPALLLFTFACRRGNSDPAEKVLEAAPTQLEEISTRIKWFTYASYIGTYVADDWGYFKEAGLKVKIEEGGPRVDATKLVAAGANDFGICGGDQLLVARSKGLPLVAIAAMMQESPAGFMVHADSEIHSMKDFAGKTMRVIPGHNTEIEYRAVMARLGIDTSSIKEVVNFSELQLFINREVDIEPIYLNNQPARAASMNIDFRTLTPTDYGVRSYGNVYFTTEKMIAERPDLVRRFLGAILKGWAGALAEPERAVDSLLKYGPTLNRDVERHKMRLTPPLMAREDGRFGWMERARWQQIADVLLETGVLKNPVAIDSVFTTEFLTETKSGE